MKTVLCYGDSNTHGSWPGRGGRFTWEQRWPGIVQTRLAGRARIIEEGLPARTTCWDDPLQPHRNGLAALPLVLGTHSPLDLVVLMLGTNDLKTRFKLSPAVIAEGIEALIDACQHFKPAPTEILLVAPVHIADSSEDMLSAFEDGRERSQQLGAHFRRVADSLGCHFMDAAEFAEASPIDGIHMDETAHQRLGAAIAGRIEAIFRL